MTPQKEALVIVGSGPAGLTAAIYAARANLKPVVIEGNTPGGQLISTSLVENWPGETSILGVELMKNMKEHALAVGTRFESGMVTNIQNNTPPFVLEIENKKTIQADAVILAMGAVPKRLECPGESEYWGKGITSCSVCDGAFYPDKQVLVIGGGDTAMESAAFLKKFTKQITVIHILDKLTASHTMQDRVINDPDITIIYNSTVTEFKGSGDRVTHAVVTNQQTNEQTTLDVDGVFISIGLNPNTDIVKEIIDLDEWGYVNVSDLTKTSVAGIFAAGDVHDFRYRQAITAAGSGCMAALDAERYLSEKSSKSD